MKIYVVEFTAEIGGKAIIGLKNAIMAFSNMEDADACEQAFEKRYGESALEHLRKFELEVEDKYREIRLLTWVGTEI